MERNTRQDEEQNEYSFMRDLSLFLHRCQLVSIFNISYLSGKVRYFLADVVFCAVSQADAMQVQGLRSDQ